MRFRRMSEERTEQEMLSVLRLVYPCAQMKGYRRNAGNNFIAVFFSLPEDSSNDGHKIDFLPDIIYIIADDDKIDGIPIDEADGLYSGISNIDILNMYKKYVIANGYSEMWLNNPYLNA